MQPVRDAARSVHQHSVDVEVSAFVTGEYAYRLSYDEVTNGLSEEENPYTGLPEAAPTGEGFHTMVRLERFDPESWEWDEIDSESVDGPDAEASAPYDDAERRIIARNGLEDRRIEVVAPWGSHTIEPEPSPAASEKFVSLNAEAKTMRDASQPSTAMTRRPTNDRWIDERFGLRQHLRQLRMPGVLCNQGKEYG